MSDQAPSTWTLEGLATFLGLLIAALAGRWTRKSKEPPPEEEPPTRETGVHVEQFKRVRDDVERINKWRHDNAASFGSIPGLVRDLESLERRMTQFEARTQKLSDDLASVREDTGYSRAKLEEFCDRFERVEERGQRVEDAVQSIADQLRSRPRGPRTP